ncbi:Fibroin heavy chain [Micromonospora saelicesensis]|nr:Fibroin heavy chain [Micromonospora saelicesensis]
MLAFGVVVGDALVGALVGAEGRVVGVLLGVLLGVFDGFGVELPVGVGVGVVVSVGVGVGVGVVVSVGVGVGVGLVVFVGDGVGVGLVVFVGDGVGVGFGGETGGVGLVTTGGAGTAPITRVAAYSRDQRTTEILTTSPVVGACTILPLPMYMPTWWIVVQLLPEAKKSRSPGSSALCGTVRPRVAAYWSRETRGRSK